MQPRDAPGLAGALDHLLGDRGIHGRAPPTWTRIRSASLGAAGGLGYCTRSERFTVGPQTLARTIAGIILEIHAPASCLRDRLPDRVPEPNPSQLDRLFAKGIQERGA